MSDQVNDLKQLDEMHASGSLTDEEYQEAKRKLLDSEPQPQQPTTVVQTRERSSFGSVVIGGLMIIALIALIFWFFNDMSNNSDDNLGAGLDANGQNGTTSLEITVPDLGDSADEGAPAEEAPAE